jgi:hypothetical protein
MEEDCRPWPARTTVPETLSRKKLTQKVRGHSSSDITLAWPM